MSLPEKVAVTANQSVDYRAPTKADQVTILKLLRIAVDSSLVHCHQNQTHGIEGPQSLGRRPYRRYQRERLSRSQVRFSSLSSIFCFSSTTNSHLHNCPG